MTIISAYPPEYAGDMTPLEKFDTYLARREWFNSRGYNEQCGDWSSIAAMVRRELAARERELAACKPARSDVGGAS